MEMKDAEIKEMVTQRVHEIADNVDWKHLNIEQRKQYYETWTKDAQIGGILGQIMDPSRVRVYLKDTVMKSYSRNQRPSVESLLISMSIPYNTITREFIKPQALLCDRTRLYTLTAAKEWKIAIMSAFERGCEAGKLRKNVVFMTDHTNGRFVDKEYRDLIDAAASRLDVEVQWLT